MGKIRRATTCGILSSLVAVSLALTSCCGRSHRNAGEVDLAPVPPPARVVIVVAPVLNFSGRPDLDQIKLTDTVASEFLSFSGVSVIPVNLTLAALAHRGKTAIDSPQDALALAREFGADATVVTAITEFNPYDPPIIGLVMQWYAPPPASEPPSDAPASAMPGGVELSGYTQVSPVFQIQRVYNAAQHDVSDEIRRFAAARDGRSSPYGWRQYVRSQELFFRYCCWATIRSMNALSASQHAAAPSLQVDP